MTVSNRERQLTAFLVAMIGVVVLAIVGITAASASVPTGSAANQPANWEAHLLNDKGVQAQCYKHEANGAGVSFSDHGVSVGNSVKLNPFNPAWYGDYWALLVIKSSTNNKVIYNPSAGVWYSGVGNHAVSHWIVCKGVTPPPQTTTRPTTTVPPTTGPTTTVAPPSSTVPPSTTTLPSSTTTAPLPTTTAPPVTSSPTSTIPVQTSSTTIEREPVVELAYTGNGWTKILGGAGIALMLAGFVLLVLDRDIKWRKFR